MKGKQGVFFVDCYPLRKFIDNLVGRLRTCLHHGLRENTKNARLRKAKFSKEKRNLNNRFLIVNHWEQSSLKERSEKPSLTGYLEKVFKKIRRRGLRLRACFLLVLRKVNTKTLLTAVVNNWLSSIFGYIDKIADRLGLTIDYLIREDEINSLTSQEEIIAMADVKQVIINVLEQNRFSATKPMSTVRTFSNDFNLDTFTCPSCGNKVVITHWEDKRGLWPDVDLPCGKCGKHWGILR